MSLHAVTYVYGLYNCQGEGGAFERRKAEVKKKKALAPSTKIKPVSHAWGHVHYPLCYKEMSGWPEGHTVGGILA